MAAIDTITTQVRTLLRDEGTLFQATVTGDGATKKYNLPVEFIDQGLAPVAVPAVYYSTPTVILAVNTDYTMDYRHGILLLTNPSLAGRVLEVDGTNYTKFLTPDIQSFINNVVQQHLHNRSDAYGNPMTIDTMPVVEQYPVAILALIEALWVLATESAYEVDVVIPDGINIPRTERFRQYLQVIDAWKAQYNYLCQMLNVGIGRIEMFDLRRTSRTTGRLVPIYREREYNQPNSPFFPLVGPVGTVVTIRGSGFLNATSLTFQGASGPVAGTMTIVDDKTITVPVPAGAVDGVITITTPGGTVATTTAFRVTAPVPTLTYGPTPVYPPIDQLLT